jgi:hypothetical protein
MEGADTWFYDPQSTPTPVHAMFNITGLEDGGSDLLVLNGQAGSIAEGMSYPFNGDNSYIDHIEAIPPAQVIFMNSEPSFAAGISYDAGTYRTVGFSFELGGLQDSDKNKDDLMIQILDFFKIQGVWTDVKENGPLADLTSGSYPNPFSNQTVIVFETEKTCRVSVDIFNVNGELVSSLVDAEMGAGIHEVIWDGSEGNGKQAANGMYFYRLRVGNQQAGGKLMKMD